VLKPALIILLFLGSRSLLAAPCCGGGSSALSLLGDEEKRQVSVSASYQSIVADVAASPEAEAILRNADDNEVRQRWETSWAELLSPRWQWNLVVPVDHRSRQRGATSVQSTGMGDIQAGLGYEFMPEWSYSSWRPRGIAYFRATLPTGRASWEAQMPLGVDTHGLGFLSFSGGLYFTKIWRAWDAIAWGQLQQGLPRTVESPFVYKLSPGLSASAGAALGYSLGDWRLGASWATNWDPEMERSGGASGVIPGARLSTVTAGLSYLYEKSWSVTLLYSDQVFAGGAHNSALGRGLSALFRTRWERN
jgi:hypothetical protein